MFDTVSGSFRSGCHWDWDSTLCSLNKCYYSSALWCLYAAPKSWREILRDSFSPKMKAMPKISKSCSGKRNKALKENCIRICTCICLCTRICICICICIKLASLLKLNYLRHTWKLQADSYIRIKGILIMRIVYTTHNECHRFYNSLTFPSRPSPSTARKFSISLALHLLRVSLPRSSCVCRTSYLFRIFVSLYLCFVFVYLCWYLAYMSLAQHLSRKHLYLCKILNTFELHLMRFISLSRPKGPSKQHLSQLERVSPWYSHLANDN